MNAESKKVLQMPKDTNIHTIRVAMAHIEEAQKLLSSISTPEEIEKPLIKSFNETFDIFKSHEKESKENSPLAYLTSIDYANMSEFSLYKGGKILSRYDAMHDFGFYIIETSILRAAIIEELNYFSRDSSQGENTEAGKICSFYSDHLLDIHDTYVLSNLFIFDKKRTVPFSDYKIISYTRDEDLFSELVSKILKDSIENQST